MEIKNKKRFLTINDDPKNIGRIYKQSANSLFNFMRQLDYLKMILENKAFIPRYYEEDIRYLKLKNNIKYIAFPMTCFCDIKINSISLHSRTYGEFGIGLSKLKWKNFNKIQPILYLNKKSSIKVSYTKAFNQTFEAVKNGDLDKYRYISALTLDYLYYIKPTDGYMTILGTRKRKNFHDEKEWRYVPTIDNGDIKELLYQDKPFNQEGLNIFSDILRTKEKYWLTFEYTDIKYLIVTFENQKKELIEFIYDKLDCDESIKRELLSKIIVLNNIEEDFK